MLNFAVHYETLKRRKPEASSSSFDGPESYEGVKRRYQVSPKSEAKKERNNDKRKSTDTTNMLDKELLRNTIEEAISDTDIFLVNITVSADNVVEVTIDSPEGIDIEQCTALSRRITEVFDRDVEDYELTVGSAGVTAPWTVDAQYRMNVGNAVDVLTRDGRRIHGTLVAVSEDCQAITVTVSTKVRREGAKRPVVEAVPHEILRSNIKTIVRDID